MISRIRQQVELYGGGLELAPESTHIKRLRERAISDDTIELFGIEPCRDGWAYPFPEGDDARRWKALDSKATPKYAWLPAKPEGAKLYYGPNLLDAVKNAGGVCWFVSGEPDVWALWSAGIKHVISGFGESSVLPDLKGILESIGVLILYIAPDLDSTGERWARLVASRLQNSAIELDARRLPSGLGERGDVGKAWELHRSQLSFERWLLGLPRYKPTLEPNKAKNHATFPEGAGNSIPAGFREMVIQALGVNGFKGNGFCLKNVKCPFHDDKNPSASLHREKGLFCHACQRWFTWLEISERLGFGTIRNWRLSNEVKISKPSGLCTEVREELIRQKRTNFARILDALILSGFQAGEEVTLTATSKAMKKFKISYSVVYRAIISAKKEILQKLPPFFLQPVQPENFAKKTRGRTSLIFRIPSNDELTKILRLDNWMQHHDPIPATALESCRKYRAEVYAALPRRNPGAYARRTLAKRLGVSNRTSQSYDKLSGLKVVPQYSRERLTSELFATLPKDRNDFPGNAWLENANHVKFQPTIGGAKRAGFPDNAVYLVRQWANHYSMDPSL